MLIYLNAFRTEVNGKKGKYKAWVSRAIAYDSNEKQYESIIHAAVKHPNIAKLRALKALLPLLKVKQGEKVHVYCGSKALVNDFQEVKNNSIPENVSLGIWNTVLFLLQKQGILIDRIDFVARGIMSSTETNFAKERIIENGYNIIDEPYGRKYIHDKQNTDKK